MYNANINGVINISPKKENMVNVTIAENSFGVKVDTLIEMCKNVVTSPILRIQSTTGKTYDYVFCSIEAITNGYSAFFKTDVDTMEIAISTTNKTFACEFVDNATIMAEFTTDPANPSVIDTEIEKSPKSVLVNYEPIQTGTGDPAPDNERPITGYNVLELNGSGKNLVEGVISGYNIGGDGVIAYNPSYDMVYGKVIEGTQYAVTTNAGQLGAGFFTSEPHAGSTSYNDARIETSSYTFTAPITGYVAFRVNANYAFSQLELGANITAYEPYQQSTDISLDLASTIYGGEWDVEKGVFKVTQGVADMGDLTWEYNSGELPYFLTSLTNYSFPTTSSQIAPPLICEKYATVAQSERTDLTICGNNGATNRIMVNDTNYSDADTFKSAVTGTKIVYELATPYEIQLTPEQVAFLEGTNTLVTNGTSIVVEYTKGRVATQADIADLAKDINSVVDFAKRAFIGKEKTFTLTYTDETLAGAVGDLYDDLIEYLLTKDANYRFSLVSIKADDTTAECFARDRKVYDNTFDGDIIADVNVGTALTYIEGKDTGSYVRTFDYSTGTYTDVSATEGSGTATLKIEEYTE